MTLLRWALALFVIAIIAGLLGFTNIASVSKEDVAKFLFFIFMAGVVILVLRGIFAARAVTRP